MDLQYDGYTAQSQSLYFPEYLNTGDPMSYYLGSGWGWRTSPPTALASAPCC